jgi:hypothetical protein
MVKLLDLVESHLQNTSINDYILKYSSIFLSSLTLQSDENCENFTEMGGMNLYLNILNVI